MRNHPRSQNPKLREALFSLADVRGNNPHGTRENSVDEGRRLNAKRYETVGQLDAALDNRASTPTQQPVRTNAAIPSTPRGASLLEAAFLLTLGAGLAYLFTRKDDDEGEDDDEVQHFQTTTQPALVQNPSAPTAPTAPTASTAPVIVVVPTHEPKPEVSRAVPAVASPAVAVAVPSKRRRKAVTT